MSIIDVSPGREAGFRERCGEWCDEVRVDLCAAKGKLFILRLVGHFEAYVACAPTS